MGVRAFGHPGKRGVIGAHEPPALRKLGLDTHHWTMKVKGIGSGYWRAVGTAEELIEKAAEIGQKWLCGVEIFEKLERQSRIILTLWRLDALGKIK